MLAHRLDTALIEATLAKARLSPRRRANHCFHAPHERLQRMVNAALEESYFAPHRHLHPGKLEIFTLLRGRAMLFAFDDEGNVEDTVLLSSDPADAARGAALQAEIPPGAWHSLAILSPEAVLYEVIDGHYDAATHKEFAPWAPAEADGEAARAYLAGLVGRHGD
jgi:cupin fold WbuC family metalloprotein